ncbi:MAG: 1-acyl-sn-glycerol-3-phosphate acyltransferase, partial [Candidatus Binatia bacterium]
MSSAASETVVPLPAGVPPALTPHPSAMRRRMNAAAEFVGRRLFRRAVVNERLVEKIRDLSEQGTIVYVLRHHSFVDYFMINYILRREDLPLPVFVNGMAPWALAPFGEMLRMLRLVWRRKNAQAEQARDVETCTRAVAGGAPVMVFMRG